jgi:hypothetical protein
MVSNIVLTVVSSSCAEASAALDITQYVQNVLAQAASQGTTLTAAQVTAVIIGCQADSRQLSVRLLVTITNLSNNEHAQVECVTSASQNAVEP